MTRDDLTGLLDDVLLMLGTDFTFSRLPADWLFCAVVEVGTPIQGSDVQAAVVQRRG